MNSAKEYSTMTRKCTIKDLEASTDCTIRQSIDANGALMAEEHQHAGYAYKIQCWNCNEEFDESYCITPKREALAHVGIKYLPHIDELYPDEIERLHRAVFEREYNEEHPDDYGNAGGFWAHWRNYSTAEQHELVESVLEPCATNS